MSVPLEFAGPSTMALPGHRGNKRIALYLDLKETMVGRRDVVVGSLQAYVEGTFYRDSG